MDIKGLPTQVHYYTSTSTSTSKLNSNINPPLGMCKGWCYFPSETDGNMRPKLAIFRLSQTEIYTSKSLFSV